MKGKKISPYTAILQQDEERVEEILLEKKVDLNAQLRGLSPLHLSCYVGNANITKMLLEAGANPDLKNEQHSTPLHIAAEAGSDECIQV